ncbi:MAG: response regulator [candidate division Zixibacteria bacterium]
MYQTIIVADDSVTARMIIKRCLEIAGLSEATFLDARDGTEALELAKNNQVDLLVTDLNMPKMDGRSLLMHVKASPRLSELPVLVISSVSNPAKVEELLGLGASAILGKPVSPADLAEVLEKLSND